MITTTMIRTVLLLASLLPSPTIMTAAYLVTTGPAAGWTTRAPYASLPRKAPVFSLHTSSSISSPFTSRGWPLFAKSSKDSKRKNERKPRGEERSARDRSRVQDPDGPTPTLEQDDVEAVDPSTIEGLAEISDPSELPRPIPHQPWRRGHTAGCEEPIAAPWRKRAEELITKAVSFTTMPYPAAGPEAPENAGAYRVVDITWYLAQVVVTIDRDEEMARGNRWLDSGIGRPIGGPPIEISEPKLPLYYDPDDPNPEPIFADEDEETAVYQRQTPEEAQAAKLRNAQRYAPKERGSVADDEEDLERLAEQEDLPDLYMNEETRADMALKLVEDEQERRDEMEQPINVDTLVIDTASLSTVAKAILDALETEEDELHILERHELILTSPGASDVLETQRQFNAFRGFPVIVETQDPFDSNRTLKGRLVDRNSMDVIINQKGRMVTIPLNFVKCVRLPPAKREKGVPRGTPF